MMNESESGQHAQSGSDIPVSPDTGAATSPTPNVHPRSAKKIKKPRGAPKTGEVIISTTIIIGFSVLMSWAKFRSFFDTHAGSISAFATISVMVLTAFYVVFARSQWIVMEDQLQQMIESSSQTERLISETHKSAEAAKASADALVASERAWIIIRVRDFPSRSSRYFQFSAINYGRTPATIVMEEWDYQYVSDPMELPTPPHYKRADNEIFLHQKIVMPRLADKIFYSFDVRTLWNACNEDTTTALMQNNKHLVTWGRVVYFDISGKRRETRFCFRFNPTIQELSVTGPWGYNDHT